MIEVQEEEVTEIDRGGRMALRHRARRVATEVAV